jgi:hypothetical protein
MDADVAIFRCGAIFGEGGRNVVAFAREAREAPLAKLALRRLLYGERRMHLVSVRRVAEVLVAAAADARVLRPRDTFLLTDDDAPENNFAFMQDRLMAAFARPSLAALPVLPPAALAGALRLRGIRHSHPRRRFVDPRLRDLAPPRATFAEDLDRYILQLGGDV